MFDADRPIQSVRDDRLNRSIFSKYLARCILDHHDINSTVLGLYGDWGSGKTSIINLVLEELNAASVNMEDKEKPIVLNFSPWSYSGQNQLIYSFFRRLSSALRNVSYLNRADHIIHLLELYVSFFTHKPVPRPLRQSRSLLDRLTFKNKEDVYGWESGRDLTEVKTELNKVLAAESRKIIIIIDNISRLSDDEIKQVFQMVKSMGDFSNTVYLLAFDKTQVTYALNRLSGRGGEEFIEKVVQLPFDIPAIDAQSLESLLISRLHDMMKEVPMDAWEKEYWADIYYAAFRYFFHTVRDVARYINILHFSYLRSRDVVHPVDFFTLTAINVFMPEVYAAIRDNKDLFTDLIDRVYLENNEFLEKDKARCDIILSMTHRVPKEVLKECLSLLFPRLRKLYHSKGKSYVASQQINQSKRVCDPDAFDIYFRLSIQEGKTTEAEFKTILSLADKPNAFDQALARLNKDERIIPFLCQLDSDVLDNVSTHHAENMLISFFDTADLFPKGIDSPLSFDTFTRLHRIICRLFEKVTVEKRFDMLMVAIEKMKNSILFAIYELKEWTNVDASVSQKAFSIQQVNALRKAICDKIAEWAMSGRLPEHPERLVIFYAWRDWGENKECEHYIRLLVQEDPGLVSFLQAALHQPILDAMTEYKKKADWANALNHITYFVPIDLITERAIAIFEDGYFEKLRESEQLAIVIFLDLVQAETQKVIPKTTA